MTTRTDTAGRWRVGDGEEARLTPGAAASAEVWSRGFLPLRVRSEGSFRLRPAFPGTAVVLGDATCEVLSETELPEDGLVVYRMRPWPEGEVVRDRVVYGRAFVRAAEAERQKARVRASARPWRMLLYPLVGLLPEEEQERAFTHRGGPSAARRSTIATAVAGALLAGALLGLYLLSLLPGPPGDPLAPFVGGLAMGLVVDAVQRIRATRQGHYAPSLFRFLVPSDSLRPERLAWHAHRDAERTALAPIGRT